MKKIAKKGIAPQYHTRLTVNILSWRLYVTPQKGKATFTVSEQFYMLILKYIPEHFHDSHQQHTKSFYYTVLNTTY